MQPFQNEIRYSPLSRGKVDMILKRNVKGTEQGSGPCFFEQETEGFPQYPCHITVFQTIIHKKFMHSNTGKSHKHTVEQKKPEPK